MSSWDPVSKYCLVPLAGLLILPNASIAHAQETPADGSREVRTDGVDDAAPVSPATPEPAPVAPAPEPAPMVAPTVAPFVAPTVAPISEPEAVTIVGTRVSKTAGSVHVLGKRELERFEYDDPQAVLARVPGVYGRGEDGVGLRPNIGMRGVNPDRSKKLTLMEDGVLFGPAPYSAPAAYFFPLITRMTQVRVTKGAGAIVYGPQTIGGALDLITRPVPRNGQTGGLDAALGSYAYNKVHAYFGSGDDTVGFLIEGIHLGNDGFKHLPDGADTGMVRNTWMFKGRYVIDPTSSIKNELTLKATYDDEISNETYVGLSDADFYADPLQRYPATQLDRMAYHRTAFALTHVVEPMAGVSITTTVYRNDHARTWRKVNHFQGADVFDVLRDPTSSRNAIYAALLRGEGTSTAPGETLYVGPNQREFVSQGIQTKVRADVDTGPVTHRLEYGLRLHYDRIERRHSEDGFLLVQGQLVPAGGPTIVTAFEEAWTTAMAMHLTDSATWGPLTLTPGVRVEVMRSAFKNKIAHTEEAVLTQVLLPGASAYLAFNDAFGALAGVNKGFSPITPGSGKDAKPESSVNYEAGLRYAKGRARFEAIGFYNDYQNLTDVCTFSSGCSNANLDRQFDAGKARIYGAEAYGELEPRVGVVGFPMSVSYTFTRPEFSRTFRSDDPIFGDVKAGDEMPYVPRHQLNATVGVETPRAGINGSMTYVSKMREVAGSGPIVDALHTDEQVVFDTSAYLKVYKALRIYANLRNVFDAHFIVSRRPYGARPNAPRWVQVGAKIDF